MKCKNVTRKCYSTFLSCTQEYLFSNPRSFWKCIKKFKKGNNLPTVMRLENKYSDNQTNFANLFTEFFSSVFNVPKVVDHNIFQD